VKEAKMTMHTITLTVNGFKEYLHVPSNMTLLQMLREELALTGTKNGCEAGECGACTVLVDGEPVNSCLMLAVEADGREVITIEGLAREGLQPEALEGLRPEPVEGQLSPLQQALVEHNAVQCGFCTPGVLISAHALLERNPQPTEHEIRAALVGNLCRCTGYLRIVQAVQAAAGQAAADQVADKGGA
jgi:carbon-monoxide dehydrogenase small subunit